MSTASYDSAVVGDALVRHYATHGLPTDGGASDPWFCVRIGPLTLRLPNPPARRRAVFFHDVNHIVTGYNTTFSDGEMTIAAFEVGSGCGPFWIAWFINLTMFALGLFVCPRAVVRAFVRGRRTASIYHRQEDRSTIAAMSVTELRTLLRLDPMPPAARFVDRLSFAAWAIVAVVVIVAPLLALTAALRGAVRLLGR
jgi:hypothetical protein